MRHLLAAGSSIGRDHLLLERPNQDAVRCLDGAWGAVAVVADGCGSEKGSGVGAALGASMTAGLAARQLERTGSLDLERLRRDVLARLGLIARAAWLSERETLLFTLVGAASAPGGVTVFACGDGVYAVDGAATVIGPFPDNAPPYIAYGLLDPGARGFESLYEGPASSVLVATDGAAGADLSPLWSDERCRRNPDMLRRLLRRMRLADDATAAVIFRGLP